MMPSDLEIEESSDERYVVSNRLEVVAVLRALKDGKSLVAARVEDGSDFVVTAILGLNPERDEILLGCAPEAERNEAFVGEHRVICVAAQDGVKVKFELSDAKLVSEDGYDAFAAAIPAQLVRVQRREYYRISAPVGTPLVCLVPAAAKTAELMAMDLSAGGLCLVDHAQGRVLKVGQCYRGCRMSLPGEGTLTFDLEVRVCADATLPNGVPYVRAGCEFVNIKGKTQGAIQRYIINLERNRNFRAVGHHAKA